MVAATLILLLVASFLFWRFVWFLRDPPRSVPEGADKIVSAADGYVTYVTPVAGKEIPMAIKNRTRIPLDELTALPEQVAQSGVLIGVYMTETSVHRNRAPVAGEVVLRRHRQAADTNRSLARMTANLVLGRMPYETGCDYLVENERLTIALRTDAGHLVSVTQIADKWIDRIVADVEPGDRLERGAQYGLIRFGSQCDVFLPDALIRRVNVSPGQYVYAGETVIAEANIPTQPSA
ncbi:MAG: phosphatidylserine decarboxylase [Rhodobacteraceae bacterium]|nr:phosphatidylserine decarboxylase [Paracoccaceae bacterium]